VAHDLSVVEHISDRVAVMYVGQLVELTETRRLFARPRHPYTEALLSAVPKPDPSRRTNRSQRIVLQGEVPDPANPPAGCYFHTRCRFAQEICRTTRPPLEETDPGHWAACHLAYQLDLRGVMGPVAASTPAAAVA
jgi:peptide/nickel transport system ATP-binding protein